MYCYVCIRSETAVVSRDSGTPHRIIYIKYKIQCSSNYHSVRNTVLPFVDNQNEKTLVCPPRPVTLPVLHALPSPADYLFFFFPPLHFLKHIWNSLFLYPSSSSSLLLLSLLFSSLLLLLQLPLPRFSSFWSDPPRSRFAIRSERFPGVVFFVSVLISFYFSIVAGVILRVFLVSPRLTSTFASRQFHRTFLFLFFRFRIISLCLVSVFLKSFFITMTGLEGVQSIPSSTLFPTYTTPKKENKKFFFFFFLCIIYTWETLVLSICGDGLFWPCYVRRRSLLPQYLSEQHAFPGFSHGRLTAKFRLSSTPCFGLNNQSSSSSMTYDLVVTWLL